LRKSFLSRYFLLYGEFLEVEVDSPEYFEAIDAYTEELYAFDAKY